LATLDSHAATASSIGPVKLRTGRPGQADAAQRLLLVLEHAVQAPEVEQRSGIGGMFEIHDPEHRVRQVGLGDFHQHGRHHPDFVHVNRPLDDALARLEGVEGGLAGLADGMADARQHGVGQRAFGCLLDQLDAQGFGVAKFFAVEVREGLEPEGLEIGLRHGGSSGRGRRCCPWLRCGVWAPCSSQW
jgi:hypothetical protein